YALLYYLYIPAVAHVKPVHLKYDTSCTKGTTCSFPYDNLTLVEKGHYELLAGGQVYSIEIVLDMPESDRNLNQGMFELILSSYVLTIVPIFYELTYYDYKGNMYL
ncbi:seipin, partial [Trichonephila clavata]